MPCKSAAIVTSKWAKCYFYPGKPRSRKQREINLHIIKWNSVIHLIYISCLWKCNCRCGIIRTLLFFNGLFIFILTWRTWKHMPVFVVSLLTVAYHGPDQARTTSSDFWAHCVVTGAATRLCTHTCTHKYSHLLRLFHALSKEKYSHS